MPQKLKKMTKRVREVESISRSNRS